MYIRPRFTNLDFQPRARPQESASVRDSDTLFSTGRYGDFKSFMAHEDFQTCLNQYSKMADKVADFVSDNANKLKPGLLPETVDAIKKHLDVFKQHLTDIKQDFFSTHKPVVYGLGKEMFHDLIALLQQANIPLQNKLNAVIRLAPQLEVCTGGILSVLRDEIVALKYSGVGLRNEAYLVRLQMIKHLITLHVKNNHDYPIQDEVHFVNAYFNHLADELGVPKIIDPLVSLGESRLTDDLKKKCRRTVLEKLRPSALSRSLGENYMDRLKDCQTGGINGVLKDERLDKVFKAIAENQKMSLNQAFGEVPAENYLLRTPDPYAFQFARQSTLVARHFMDELKDAGAVDFQDSITLTSGGKVDGSIRQLGDLMWREKEGSCFELGAAELMAVPLSAIRSGLQRAGIVREQAGSMLRASLDHVLSQSQREELEDIPDYWLDGYTELLQTKKMTSSQTVPALLLAANFDKPRVIAELVTAGVELNGSDSDGTTALMMAVKRGNAGAVDALIAADADIGAVNAHGLSATMLAASTGQTGLLKKLLAAGASIDGRDGKGDSLSMFAIRNGHIQTVRELIRLGANFDAPDDLGYTGTMRAAENGNADMLGTLLAHGADGNAADDHGNTAVMFAAEKGHAGTVKILIGAGADVTVANSNGSTALMCAAEYGHGAVADLLLAQNSDPDACNENGHTALSFAAKYNRAEIIRTLVGAGASIEFRDQEGFTPLAHAVQGNRVDAVRTLIELEADVDAFDCTLASLAMHAAQNGSAEALQLLIDSGNIDLTACDQDGSNALIAAAAMGHVKVLEMLIGAIGPEVVDLLERQSHGMSAAMYAAQNGAVETLRCLLDHGANVDAVSSTGLTALLYAAANQRAGAVNLLIEKRANVNVLTPSEDSALIFAAANKQMAVFKALLAAGANVAQHNQKGFSAALYAAIHGQIGMLEMLLDAGADIHQTDSRGRNLADWALLRNHEDMHARLIERGASLAFVEQAKKVIG